MRKWRLRANTKPIKFLQFCCATPSASVIGIKPTPFSLGSLAEISEIFLGWYKFPHALPLLFPDIGKMVCYR
jgi:hypothetical protein